RRHTIFSRDWSSDVCSSDLSAGAIFNFSSAPSMDIEFNKNEDALKQLSFQLKTKLKKIYLGGGEKNIAKQHAKGKLTARERIDRSEERRVGKDCGTRRPRER